jgi:fucose permease
MIALAAVGLFDGALGVAWPSMRVTFDQPLAALGVVLLSYTGGYFVTSFAGGWLLERVGTGAALIGVACGAIAGASLFAIAPVWPVVLAGAVLLGASGGAADLTLNHELAQHHGVRALGFLHAAWGLGAAIGPILVTGVVAGGRTWRWAFVPVVVVQVGLLAVYVVLRRTWAPVPRRADEPGDAEPLDRVALLFALGLFLLYVGVEAGAGQWGFTLLTDGRGMADRSAGAWMSSYWLALTAGRLALGFGGHRRSPNALLTASVLGSVAAAVVLWLDPFGVGYVALAPLGFALAAVFPVLVAVTPERLGTHRAARAIGLQIAASSVGGVGIPSAMGLGAQAWGVSALAPMLAVGAGALAALHAVALRRQRPTTA